MPFNHREQLYVNAIVTAIRKDGDFASIKVIMDLGDDAVFTDLDTLSNGDLATIAEYSTKHQRRQAARILFKRFPNFVENYGRSERM